MFPFTEKSFPDNVALLGFGAALVDELVQVDDAFIAALNGQKGGALQVSNEEMTLLQAALPEKPLRQVGGAAANTLRAFAALGGNAGFLSLVGDDEIGAYYLQEMHKNKLNCKGIKIRVGEETGRCLSMISPDSERTMRTRQGVAAKMCANDFHAEDFQDYTHLFVEGYALYTPDVAGKIMNTAYQQGLKIAYDAGSPELVANNRDTLKVLLNDYVTVAFFNELEACAFADSDDPLIALQKLSELCPLAVVKLGSKGVYIAEENAEKISYVAAKNVNPLDSTGAGDFWAAAFLYAWLTGKSVEKAADLANAMAATVIQQIGTELNEEFWRRFQLLI